jgi:hypothetical protein
MLKDSGRFCINTGIIYEQIDGFAMKQLRQFVNFGMIAYIERMHLNPIGMSASQLVERVRVFGKTAASDDMPAIRSILLTEFQTNSTV